MAKGVCLDRLRKELRQIEKKPIENIHLKAKESNILEWHYVLEGIKGTCYEGGYYHGVLIFPSAYPFKPPSIQMYTPSGRFKTNTRLCLSMSDFHPESWNPMWSVGTIIMGLYSFMHENTATLGSIELSDFERRKLAKESLSFNCKNKDFIELFPELKELNDKIEEEKKVKATQESSSDDSVTNFKSRSRFQDSKIALYIITVFIPILFFLFIIFYVSFKK